MGHLDARPALTDADARDARSGGADRRRDASREVGGPAGSRAAGQHAAVHRRRDLRANDGYLKQRHADIGSRVKAGQLLAEIDTPEIDQQLLQARADLATAEANAKLAQTTAERYRDLIKSDSVVAAGRGQRERQLRREAGGGAVGASPT